MKSATAVFTLLAIALASTPARAQNSVNLTWTASADAAANPSLAYNVYRSPICTGAFVKMNASPVAATGYLDSGVLPGSYCYQVNSVLSGVEGSASNQAAVLIPGQTLTQQLACRHRGNIIGWLRCVASVQHAQPRKGKSAP